MDIYTKNKIHEICESVKDDYLLSAIEENQGISEVGVLRMKKFLKESVSKIEKMLVEEGYLDYGRAIIEESFKASVDDIRNNARQAVAAAGQAGQAVGQAGQAVGRVAGAAGRAVAPVAKAGALVGAGALAGGVAGTEFGAAHAGDVNTFNNNLEGTKNYVEKGLGNAWDKAKDIYNDHDETLTQKLHGLGHQVGQGAEYLKNGAELAYNNAQEFAQNTGLMH